VGVGDPPGVEVDGANPTRLEYPVVAVAQSLAAAKTSGETAVNLTVCAVGHRPGRYDEAIRVIVMGADTRFMARQEGAA